MLIFYTYVDNGTLTISRILLIIYSNKNIEGVFMGKIFKNDVSVLFNNNPISEDFHLYECGYEECKPTKPYEFVPIALLVKVFFKSKINKTISKLAIFL